MVAPAYILAITLVISLDLIILLLIHPTRSVFLLVLGRHTITSVIAGSRLMGLCLIPAGCYVYVVEDLWKQDIPGKPVE